MKTQFELEHENEALRKRVEILEQEIEGAEDDIKDRDDEIRRIENDLKEAQRVDREVKTALGSIEFRTSGNLRHIQMIEDFIAKVEREA